MLSLLQKLPTLVPFLVGKVETQSCKRHLADLKTELNDATEDGANKATLPMVKKAICKIPKSCTEEIFRALKKMVQSGGMVEKVAKTFLEGKGLDLETADLLIMGYVENLCGADLNDDDLAKIMEEL